ncbi:MAG: phospholipase D family protein [Deltaproteobacteria bacterium]|nr:phospholipase D family protein [Deltaproteobacteria bacterium]
MALIWSPDHYNHLLRLARTADKVVIGTAYLTPNPLVNVLLQRSRTVPVTVVAGLSPVTDKSTAESLRAAGASVMLAPRTSGGGIFHAKVYGFLHGDKGVVVVGSGNLTGAAFVHRGNVEVFTETIVSADEIHALEARLLAYGVVSDLSLLADLDDEAERGAPVPQVPEGLLSMSWKEYVAALTAQNAAWRRHWGSKFGEKGSWLDTLWRFEALPMGPLNKLTSDQRRLLAGAPLGDINPAYFGELKAAGKANGHILRADTPSVLKVIDAARQSVGAIGDPLSIDDAMYAFKKIMGLKGFAFATASRLLGSVRPDIFVILNKASIEGLNSLLGSNTFPNYDRTEANIDRYRALLTLVQQAPWWRSPCPSGDEESIWRGRALLLDTFVYDVEVGGLD